MAFGGFDYSVCKLRLHLLTKGEGGEILGICQETNPTTGRKSLPKSEKKQCRLREGGFTLALHVLNV